MLFKLFTSENSKKTHVADEDEVGTLCNHSLQFKHNWRVPEQEYELEDKFEVVTCKHCLKQLEMIEREMEED